MGLRWGRKWLVLRFISNYGGGIVQLEKHRVRNQKVTGPRFDPRTGHALFPLKRLFNAYIFLWPSRPDENANKKNQN